MVVLFYVSERQDFGIEVLRCMNVLARQFEVVNAIERGWTRSHCG